MLQISRIICLLMLIILSIYDIKMRGIPLIMVKIIFLMAISYCVTYKNGSVLETCAGIGVGVMFLIISYITGEKIGYGDSAVILSMGIYLGFEDLLGVLLIAFLSVMAAAMGFAVKSGVKKNTVLPFIPFIAAGYSAFLVAGGWS